MGIAAQITDDWHAAMAALAWQVDLGLTEVMGEVPQSAYDLPERAASAAVSTPVPVAPARVAATPPPPDPDGDPDGDPGVAIAEAQRAAEAAPDLSSLHAALSAFPHCDLKKGARNTVFADGHPQARVLILGEAPGRDEDIEGRPFVGAAGQLLDRMFAAIGLSRTSPDPEHALYITNVMPWRPPGNRDPAPGEIAMMRPFVARHIELVDPDVVVVMGNTPLLALTGAKGILRARGQWTTALDKPLLPMTHPAYLLRNPIAKREAWADLLSLQARLRV